MVEDPEAQHTTPFKIPSRDFLSSASMFSVTENAVPGWDSLSKQLAILYQSLTVSLASVPSSPSFNYTGSSKSFPGPTITGALCPSLQVLWDTV